MAVGGNIGGLIIAPDAATRARRRATTDALFLLLLFGMARLEARIVAEPVRPFHAVTGLAILETSGFTDRATITRVGIFKYGMVEINTGEISQIITQLVFQHLCLDLFHRGFRHFTQLERPEGHADEAVHIEAKGGQNVLHLAVLAFAQRDRQPAIVALHPVQRRFDGAIFDPVDDNALGQTLQPFGIDMAMGPHTITAQPACGRQFHHAREATIIGEQQQAFGVDIEAAHCHDARQIIRQGIENRRATLRVIGGGDKATRLVEQPEPCALPLRQGAAIDQHLVLIGHIDSRGGEHLAIQHNAASLDPLFRLAARAQAHTSQDTGNTLLALVDGIRPLTAHPWHAVDIPPTPALTPVRALGCVLIPSKAGRGAITTETGGDFPLILRT